jgi:hypothetical protein
LNKKILELFRLELPLTPNVAFNWNCTGQINLSKLQKNSCLNGVLINLTFFSGAQLMSSPLIDLPKWPVSLGFYALPALGCGCPWLLRAL